MRCSLCDATTSTARKSDLRLFNQRPQILFSFFLFRMVQRLLPKVVIACVSLPYLGGALCASLIESSARCRQLGSAPTGLVFVLFRQGPSLDLGSMERAAGSPPDPRRPGAERALCTVWRLHYVPNERRDGFAAAGEGGLVEFLFLPRP